MRVSDILQKINETIKLNYLGIGFVWAWVYYAFDTSAISLSISENVGLGENPTWLASAMAVVVFLFIFGACLNDRSFLGMRLIWASALFMSIGTLVSVLLSGWFLIGMFVCGLLTGIGSALAIILWCEAFLYMETDSFEISIPASYAVMLICTLVFHNIEGMARIIGIAVLPLLSALCLIVTMKELNENDAPGEISKKKVFEYESGNADRKTFSQLSFFAAHCRKSSFNMPLIVAFRLLLLLFVAYFIIGFISSMLGNPSRSYRMFWGFDVSAFIGSLAGLALAVAFVQYSRRVDLSVLFRWLSPVMVIGIALFAFDLDITFFLVDTMICVADSLLQIITILYFVGLARRGGISACFGVGISQGTIQLGVLIGHLAAFFIVGFEVPSWVEAMVLICLLSVAMAFAPSHYLDTAVLHDSSKETTIPRNDKEENWRKDMLDLLTKEKGLSMREAEILDYLSKGRSQPYIRDELVLSKNTVASHVKHIYRKLDVHSRQELLDLFEPPEQ